MSRLADQRWRNRQSRRAAPIRNQIIGGEESEDSEYYESLDRDTSDDTHGRRLLSIEYNLFHEDSVRTRTEHGVVLRLSQETLQHGTFSVDARAKYDSVGGDADNQVGDFSVSDKTSSR